MSDRKLTKVGLLLVDNWPVFQSRIFCTRWVGYAKGMSASDIEEGIRGIYGIEFFYICHFHHYQPGKPGSPEMPEPPFGSCLSDSLDDGIVFKVRDNGKIINKTVISFG